MKINGRSGNFQFNDFNDKLVIEGDEFEVLNFETQGKKTLISTPCGKALIATKKTVEHLYHDFSIPRGIEDPRGIQKYVHRFISTADLQQIEKGRPLVPKNQWSSCSAEGHILKGSQKSFKGSRFISCCGDMNGVRSIQQKLPDFCRVAGIDQVFRVDILVDHITKEKILNASDKNAPLGMRASRYARKDHEILIEGDIPFDAIDRMVKYERQGGRMIKK